MPKKKKAPPRAGARRQPPLRRTAYLGEHEHPVPRPFQIPAGPDSTYLRHVGNMLAQCEKCCAETRAEMDATRTDHDVLGATDAFVIILATVLANSSAEVGPLIGEQVAKGLPETARGLLAAAEEGDDALDVAISKLTPEERAEAVSRLAELGAVLLAAHTGAWDGTTRAYEKAINTPLRVPGA